MTRISRVFTHYRSIEKFMREAGIFYLIWTVRHSIKSLTWTNPGLMQFLNFNWPSNLDSIVGLDLLVQRLKSAIGDIYLWRTVNMFWRMSLPSTNVIQFHTLMIRYIIVTASKINVVILLCIMSLWCQGQGPVITCKRKRQRNHVLYRNIHTSMVCIRVCCYIICEYYGKLLSTMALNN